MTPLRQDIRFARTRDGLRIAYAVSGHGYPLVRGATWFSNVAVDAQTSITGPLFREISARYCLYRYNARGYGLSEGEGSELSVESFVSDLEAVIDAAKLERVALWGPTTAGAIPTIAYAARHSDRVSHLVLSGPAARGPLRRSSAPEEEERFRAFVKLIELGWDKDNPAFRQILTTQLFPGATKEQLTEFNELLRVSVSPRQAARMVMATGEADVSGLLGLIRCPTLVLLCRDAALMSIAEARLIASSIKNTRFVSLDSRNYIPLAGEQAFTQMIEEIETFLPKSRSSVPKHAVLAELTPREREVLDLVAQGLDNPRIARRLEISEKTVRNTVSHIFDKLDVESRAQLIVLARRAGLGE